MSLIKKWVLRLTILTEQLCYLYRDGIIKMTLLCLKSRLNCPRSQVSISDYFLFWVMAGTATWHLNPCDKICSDFSGVQTWWSIATWVVSQRSSRGGSVGSGLRTADWGIGCYSVCVCCSSGWVGGGVIIIILSSSNWQTNKNTVLIEYRIQ